MEILIVLAVILVVFAVQVAILRWIFRVNEIVDVLKEIRDKK